MLGGPGGAHRASSGISGGIPASLLKDGVFVGPSPLQAAIDAAGGVGSSARVRSFLQSLDHVCASYATTSGTTRSKWYQLEFRGACEAAVPIAGELCARAIGDAAVTPITAGALLEHVACHVSAATGEKVQKLLFVSRMVAASHAAPSSHLAHAGTPASAHPTASVATGGRPGVGKPSVSDFPSGPMSLMSAGEHHGAAGGSSTVAAAAGGAADGSNKKAARRDDTGAADASSRGRRQPSAEPADGADGPLNRRTSSAANATTSAAAVPPGASQQQQRPMSTDKLNVIMPWTIPAPFDVGVVLRRVQPKHFRPPKANAVTSGTVTVQSIVEAVGTPDVYALWLQREAQLSAMGDSSSSSSSNGTASAANGVGNGASSNAVRSVPVDPAAAPSPLFPHASAAAQAGGGRTAAAAATQPALLLLHNADPAAARHVTVRRSFLTALAHFGVHALSS